MEGIGSKEQLITLRKYWWEGGGEQNILCPLLISSHCAGVIINHSLQEIVLGRGCESMCAEFNVPNQKYSAQCF